MPDADGVCSCDWRREAMRSGEMLRDRWGRWKWPLNFVAEAFQMPRPIYAWTFCPFCGGDLPFTSSEPLLPPPQLEAGPDVQADGEGEG